MGSEGMFSMANQPGSFFGAELATHERIRFVQSQIRIAIQNHHLLYTRSLAFPHDAELENHMKILQDLILSLGRSQVELMYQFKVEVKEKHGTNNFKNVMAAHLGWPNRHEMSAHKLKENGVGTFGERRAHIMKRKPILCQSARPKVKMQSLLKVNHNKSIIPPRKESERLKAAATKQFESHNSVLREAKKLQSVLKSRDSQVGQSLLINRRPSVTDDKSGDSYDIKDPTSSGSTTAEATSIEDVTQDLFLGFFGLVHKDKSKSMVSTQTKRKRRSAAGQSNLYGDFSYFQAKRTYTKKNVASSSVPESPCSSQDIGEVDENDRLSLNSTEKPSEPASPEAPCSQDEPEKMEIVAENGSSAATSMEVDNSAPTVQQTTAAPQEIADSQETANSQQSFSEDIRDSLETSTAPQSISAKEIPTTEEAVTEVGVSPSSQEVATSQESSISQEMMTSGKQEISEEVAASQETMNDQSSGTEKLAGDVTNKEKECTGNTLGNNESDVLNGDEKMIVDEDVDRKTEPLTPDSDEPPKSPLDAASGNISSKEPPLNHKHSKDQEDQLIAQEEGMVHEDCQGNKSPHEQEILLEYSPETVDVLAVSEVQPCNTEPQSSNVLRYSPQTGTVEAIPLYKAVSPCSKIADKRSSGDGDTNPNILTFDVDDESNDSDPTSIIPNAQSQNPESASSSKCNVCSVCCESGAEKIEKCGICGELYHKECVENCPSCQDTRSSFSSIVGVDAVSKLTSTDCSEVVKRYLDDNQEEEKGSSVRGSDDGDDENEVNDVKSNSNVVVSRQDKEHEDFDETVNLQGSMDLDSTEDQISEANESTTEQDGKINEENALLEDDDSLEFSDTNLFEDYSCNSSL